MHVWWNYPPCIQRCHKDCLPVNTTVVLRGFTPGWPVTVSGDPGGTLLVNTDGSVGSRDLQPASRDS